MGSGAQRGGRQFIERRKEQLSGAQKLLTGAETTGQERILHKQACSDPQLPTPGPESVVISAPSSLSAPGPL